MIAEGVPDASARVFVGAEDRKSAAAAAAMEGTTEPATATTSKPPQPPPPVSAAFARANPWTDLSSPMDTKQCLFLFCCIPFLLWRIFLTAMILPCVHLTFMALVAKQDLGKPLGPWRARCTNALLR